MKRISSYDSSIIGYYTPEGEAYPVLVRLLNVSMNVMIQSLIEANIRDSSFIALVKFINHSKVVISMLPKHKLSTEEKQQLNKKWEELNNRLQILSLLSSTKQFCSKEDIMKMHELLELIIFALDKSGLGWQHSFIYATKEDIVNKYLKEGR